MKASHDESCTYQKRAKNIEKKKTILHFLAERIFARCWREFSAGLEQQRRLILIKDLGSHALLSLILLVNYRFFTGSTIWYIVFFLILLQASEPYTEAPRNFDCIRMFWKNLNIWISFLYFLLFSRLLLKDFIHIHENAISSFNNIFAQNASDQLL